MATDARMCSRKVYDQMIRDAFEGRPWPHPDTDPKPEPKPATEEKISEP